MKATCLGMGHWPMLGWLKRIYEATKIQWIDDKNDQKRGSICTLRLSQTLADNFLEHVPLEIDLSWAMMTLRYVM